MNRVSSLLLVFALAFIIAGCVDTLPIIDPVPGPQLPAELTIRTDTAHVSVLIDGGSEGRTDRDGVLELSLDPGTYRIRLEKQGFVPIEEQVTLEEGEQDRSYDLEQVLYDESFSNFIWAGEPGRQFNDAEFDGIARYDLFVIEKFHALWDYTAHFDAAFEAKNRNPDQIILPYLAPKYRFLNDRFGLETFNDEWLLRDRNGDPIPFIPAQNQESGIAIANYTDFSNLEYRQWVVDLVLDWNEQAPFDGIAFDHMTRFAYGFNRPVWDNRIGSEKVDAWNEGLLLLIEETKTALGPDKIVIYNGISRRDRTDDRNFEQLDYADGALNEVFCVGPGLRLGEVPDIWSEELLVEDIDIQRGFGDKVLLQKTNYDRTVTGDERNTLSGFCMGLYAMGHVPGQTFYKYGHGYNVRFEEITANAQGYDVRFGEPLAEYRSQDGVLWREFEGGLVIVNPGEEARSVEVPFDVAILYRDDAVRFSESDILELEPQSAIFAERI
jgi:hypothetical protein